MKILLAAVVPRRSRPKGDPAERMMDEYIERAARYTPVTAQVFETEPDLMSWIEGRRGRVAPFFILLDSRGKQFSSDEFAVLLNDHRERGTQQLVLAIGPANGWSPDARASAGLVLSLGKITLPHQLARVVLAEQVYRALTILAGHPYHCGH